MPKPPKPESLPCRYCGEPGRVAWHVRGDKKHGAPKWERNTRCDRCINITAHHGMTLEEHSVFLGQGCAISGCDKTATDIDHDHAICPQRMHSCTKCRRGPLCNAHNQAAGRIEKIATGKYDAVLKYLNVSIKVTKGA